MEELTRWLNSSIDEGTLQRVGLFFGTVAIALLPELATALPAWWARR